MKINELTQQGTRTEYREVLVPAVYDDEGNVAEEARYETVEIEVPVMVAVTRDMTPDEIAEHERMQAELPDPEPTPQERMDAIEDALVELAAILTEGE